MDRLSGLDSLVKRKDIRAKATYPDKGFPGLGDRINERVRALGYKNINRFALDRKLDKASLYAYTAGRVPRFDTLEKLAKELVCPWQWLIIGDEGLETLLRSRNQRPATSDQRQKPGQALTLPAEVAEDTHQPPASAADARYFVEPLIVAAATAMPEAARPRFQFRAAHLDPTALLQWFIALVEREPLPSDLEPPDRPADTTLRSSIMGVIHDAKAARRDQHPPTAPRGITGYRPFRRRPRTP
jgi:hypothetical protein